MRERKRELSAERINSKTLDQPPFDLVLTALIEFMVLALNVIEVVFMATKLMALSQLPLKGAVDILLYNV